MEYSAPRRNEDTWAGSVEPVTLDLAVLSLRPSHPIGHRDYLGKKKRRSELSSYEKTWRNFQGISWCARRQSEEATYCMTPAVWYSAKGETGGIVNISVVAQGWERRVNRAQGICRVAKIFCLI